MKPPSSAQKQEEIVENERPSVNNRAHLRQVELGLHNPISCILNLKNEQIRADIVNFHFHGACLKVKTTETQVLSPDVTLDFHLGNSCVRSGLKFRVCWQDIQNTGCFGVEFLESIEKHVRLNERVAVHQLYPPTLVGKDPFNPVRQIFFKVSDFSQTGLLLITSATNNYLFPGMSLDQCQLSIPGRDLVSIDIFIESVRPGETSDTIKIGVTIRGQSRAFQEAISEYAIYLSPSGLETENRLEHIMQKANIKSRALKAGLTFKVVNTEQEYEKVLKLRFIGYGKAGKVKTGGNWQEMGEGLANEGVILGAYLSGQLVGSVELRNGGKMPLRTSKYIPNEKLSEFNIKRVIEPNKLVVHPQAQGSDIVMGLIQRIHAMAVVEGNLDILLLATDKLATFYNRMGARKLGVKVPHPVIPDQSLNLMIAESDMYSKGIGINPFFWSQVWEAIHQHFIDMGVLQPISAGLLYKIKKLIGKSVWTLFQLKNGKLSQKKSASRPASTTDKAGFIDPKWTAQHLGAHVMLPYLLQAEELIGKKNVALMLSALRVPRDYFFKQSNWFSMSFFDSFIEEYKKYGNIDVLQRESGRKSMAKEVLGFTYYFLKHLASPEVIFRSIGKVASRFNTTRSFKLVHIQPGKAVIHVGHYDKNLLPKDPSACLNWIGNFECVVELTTGKKGKVNKLACFSQGHSECIYEVIWDKRSILPKYVTDWAPLVISVFSVMCLFLTVQKSKITYSVEWSMSGISILLLAILYSKFVTKYRGLSKEFEKYHQESDDRYNDLQKSKSILDQNYKEATLLETLSKDIQRQDHLTTILNTTTSTICEKFGFSRSFIMLIDRESNILRTASVSGTKEHADLLWNFSVDVSKARENPLVLSSTYLTGQPILISNVEEHLFQLNLSSKNLIKTLNTRGFIIVPIPALENNWGVIVADKSTDSAGIDRRELVMLQRVAQHLGIALDKKAKLEQEEKLRLLFQKYVPAQVVNGVPTNEVSMLGAKKTDVTCMFVDIRGFTKLSESYPTEVVLDILNRFFGLVQSVVKENSGIIDKFLGDGVLAIWGMAPNQSSHTHLAVHAAFEILTKLEVLNKDFTSNSLPKIEIGVGINTGFALVGNVGSEERMEFTAIGPTVNLASRLEGLCKIHKSEIVISESVLKKLDQKDIKIWEIKNNIEVKGLNQFISIGTLKQGEGYK